VIDRVDKWPRRDRRDFDCSRILDIQQLLAYLTDMKNPFPGMNPYLEEHWGDVHTSLTTYIRDQLQERLPPDLVARAEEQVTIDEGEGRVNLRPDVQVTEARSASRPIPAVAPMGSSATALAEPLLVLVEPEVQRWIEIAEASGRLITVIEVLSPTNKSSDGESDYRRRQRAYISGGVNLVEIDLLRGGKRVFSAPSSEIPNRARTWYMVCVYRATEAAQRELYPLNIREPLPAIRIPLRPSDPDVVLELQPLIDQAFDRGRYALLDYARDPEPPFSEADARWCDEILRKSGLRS
jgi:hypothetical protein